MSIIHEALKKVQARGTSAAIPAVPAKPKGSPLVLMALLIIAATLAAAAYYYFIYNRPVVVPAATVIAAAPAAAPATTPVPAIAQTEVPTSVILNVQGLMTNNGATVALINGKIYEQGSEINGIKILAIEGNSITVLRDGKEETIRVRN